MGSMIDLNVIIDVFLAREGFEFSKDVLELGESGDYQLYISAHMITTFAYLLEDANVSRPKILKHISWLLDTFTVVAIDSQLLRAAAKSRVTDFEDAVVEQAAVQAKAAVIITRNIRDFRNSVIPARSPKDYMRSLSADGLL